MNPRILPGLLVLSAALGLAPVVSLSADSRVDDLVPMLDFEDVTLDTHRSVVTQRLGEPSDRFSPDVWIYWDYRDPRRAADERYKTVVLVFSGDRLTHIRFTDTAATRAALAEYRRGLAIAALLLTSTTPFGEGHQLSGEDAELRAAIDQGRASIRMFLEAFTKPAEKQNSWRVKIAFVKEGVVEHLWLASLNLNGAKPTGIIASPPRRHDLKLNQQVEFDPSQLCDWMYVEDGELVGGFTTRLLHRRMMVAGGQN